MPDPGLTSSAIAVHTRRPRQTGSKRDNANVYLCDPWLLSEASQENEVTKVCIYSPSPVWPSGKALGWEAEGPWFDPLRLSFLFSSKIVIYGHCLVTLPTQLMKH